MINDAGALQGIPWEVLIKAYRDRRGTQQFDFVADYAQDLFDFIKSDEDIFPSSYQTAELRKGIIETAINIGFYALAAGQNLLDQGQEEARLNAIA
jgi:hypothetical protein